MVVLIGKPRIVNLRTMVIGKILELVVVSLECLDLDGFGLI